MKKQVSLFMFCVVASGLMAPMKAMKIGGDDRGVKRKRSLEDPADKMNEIIGDHTYYREGEKSYHVAEIRDDVDSYLKEVSEREKKEMGKTYDYPHILKYAVGLYGASMLEVLNDIATKGDNENEVANTIRSHLKTNWKLEGYLEKANTWRERQQRPFFCGDEQDWQCRVAKRREATRQNLLNLLHEDW